MIWVHKLRTVSILGYSHLIKWICNLLYVFSFGVEHHDFIPKKSLTKIGWLEGYNNNDNFIIAHGSSGGKNAILKTL